VARRLLSLLCALVLVLALGTAIPAGAQTTEADVYVAQAIIEIDEKKYDDALENLRKALDVEPEHVEALYYTGVVYAAQRKPAEAAPFLEKARAKSPKDPAIAYQLGLAYFAQQQYERAQPLFEEVFKTNPELDGLGYYTGFLRYRNKDYRGALAAFRDGRSTDVEVQQLTRFYTGLALGVLGLPAQAAAEVEQALRLAPGTPLVGPAERLRDTIIAARKAERRLSAEVRVGVTYDDNVDVRPTPNNREPQVAELRTHRHESFGELFGARADYIWWKGEDSESTIGYSFFTTYNNDIPKFNVIDHLASLGVSRRLSVGPLPALANALYAWDTLALDGDEFLTRNTFTVSLALVEGEGNLTQIFARFQNKDFAKTTEPRQVRQEERDANNWMAGFLHFVRFAQDKHFVKAGWQLDYDDTGGANYEYVGHRFSVGGQYTLPWQAIRLKYDLDVHVRAYTTVNSLFPTYAPGTKQRRDEEITNVLRAEWPLPRSLTLAAEYQTTRTRSNLEVFDFNRNVVSLVLSWSY
jgi:tetratricopeptide (TPR) repeat protein